VLPDAISAISHQHLVFGEKLDLSRSIVEVTAEAAAKPDRLINLSGIMTTVRDSGIRMNPVYQHSTGMRLMARILPRCIIDLVTAAVPKAIAKWAEAEMVSETYEFQDRRKIAADPHAAREAARTAKAEGKTEDILTVLEERGLTVSGEERERIISSTDSRQLDKWLRRAVTADKASDLFAD
jgi:hypothetical protein